MPEERAGIDPAGLVTDIERRPRNHRPAGFVQPQITAQFTRHELRLGRLQNDLQSLLVLEVLRNHAVIGVDGIIQAPGIGRLTLRVRQRRQVLLVMGQQITDRALQCHSAAGVPLHLAQLLGQRHKPRPDDVISAQCKRVYVQKRRFFAADIEGFDVDIAQRMTTLDRIGHDHLHDQPFDIDRPLGLAIANGIDHVRRQFLARHVEIFGKIFRAPGIDGVLLPVDILVAVAVVNDQFQGDATGLLEHCQQRVFVVLQRCTEMPVAVQQGAASTQMPLHLLLQLKVDDTVIVSAMRLDLVLPKGVDLRRIEHETLVFCEGERQRGRHHCGVGFALSGQQRSDRLQQIVSGGSQGNVDTVVIEQAVQ